jgi:tryptophan synthase alpha chain
MNRIDTLFANKQNNILSIYFTAGHPGLNDTVPVIEALAQNGVDMIEIGMPFSDPMADGPVIQQSSQIALNNGMSLHLLFDQLADIRKKTEMPLLLMGYLNPVYRFGFEKFCQACARVGIDGLILPDMPIDEYRNTNKSIMDKYGLYNIFLVTPQTSSERLEMLNSLSQGFIYMVSSYSTTGSGKGLEMSQAYFERMRDTKHSNPKVVGFGIKNKADLQHAWQYAQGGIIGSAFVKALEGPGTIFDKAKSFVTSLK